MIEKKDPTAASPEIRRDVRGQRGSTDGREAVSAISARRVKLGHKEPRTQAATNMTSDDLERLKDQPSATAHVNARGAVKMVTYYRPPEEPES
jgi:hypothetical protein